MRLSFQRGRSGPGAQWGLSRDLLHNVVYISCLQGAEPLLSPAAASFQRGLA